MDKIRQKLQKYNEFDEAAALSDFMDENMNKKPTLKTDYVGIEIECYGPLKPIEIQKRILLMDLEEYADIDDDGSIHPPITARIQHTYEIRLLIPENKLTDVLKKFGKLFQKARLKTNHTCGLHIHIDMRNRKYKECLAKLRKFEDTLFSLVSKDRWTSRFCMHTEFLNTAEDERYMAINGDPAYDSHRTIEVRLHEGTVNVRKIEKWIHVLLNVIKSKNIPALKSKEDVLKWDGLNKKSKSYIRLNYKDGWEAQKAVFSNQRADPRFANGETEDDRFRRQFINETVRRR